MINDPKMIKKLKQDFNKVPERIIKDAIKEVFEEESMSKADEMFEKLGYRIVNSNPMCKQYQECNKINNAIFYEKENHYLKEYPNIYNFDYFIFDLDRKRFLKFNYDHQRIMFITAQELRTINEKVKELGWINE